MKIFDAIEEKYNLCYIQSAVEEGRRASGGGKYSINIKPVMDLSLGFEALKSDIHEASVLTTKFWDAYQEPEVKVTKLWKFGLRINKMAAVIDIAWKRMEEKFDHIMSKEYSLYGLYLMILRNSYHRAQQILKRLV